MTAPTSTPPLGRRLGAIGRRAGVGSGAGALIIALLLVATPVFIMITTAAGWGSAGSRLGRNFAETFSAVVDNPRFADTIKNTLILVTVGAIGSVTVGTLFAFLLGRTDMPGAKSRILRVAPLFTFVVPGIVLFFAWMSMYTPRAGMFNIFLRSIVGSDASSGPTDIVSMPGLLIAYVTFLVPITYQTVRGSFEGGAPQLEEAARMSGAKPWRVIRTVTLPLATPAILSAGLLALVFGVGLYLIPKVITVPRTSHVASVAIRRAVTSSPADYGQAAMWAIFIVAIAIGLVLLRRRVISGKVYTAVRSQTVDGEARPIPLGKLRWVAFGFYWIYMIMVLVLPLIGITILAFLGFWSPNVDSWDFTFNNFVKMTELAPDALEGLKNSFLLGIGAATIGVALSLWFAMGGRRRAKRIDSMLELVSFMPLAIPPVIVGTGMLIFVLNLAPGIYGSPFPLIVAYVIITMPFASQIVRAGVSRIPPEMEMASAVSGARRWQTVRHIVAPLLATELIGAWVFIGVFVIREFDASMMLASSQSGRTPIASVEMLGVWENGFAPAAAAFGLVILGATIALLVLGGGLRWALKRI